MTLRSTEFARLAPRRLPGAIGLAAIVLLLATAAILFLRSDQRQAEAARHEVGRLRAELHAHSALEWKAVADGRITNETREREAVLSGAIRRSVGIVARDRHVPERATLARRVDTYLRGAGREFRLIALGDVEAAREVDDQVVDPVFESVEELVESADQALEDVAATTSRRANLGSIGIALGSLLMLLGLGLRILRIEKEAARNDGVAAARAEHEEELRQAQKMEAVGLLAGGVAHDFNNLLTIVSGYGELVVKELGPEHACQSAMTNVLDAAGRASKLTRQLLALGGRQKISPVELELGAVCENMRPLLQSAVGSRIALSCQVSEPVRILADGGQLEQVLLNLVVNAGEATPDGGRIDISVRRRVLDAELKLRGERLKPGNYVELAVKDSGVGIDEQTLSQIFDPYFTTKGASGNGLGLSSVWGILSQNGGSIDVESAPGYGSEFRVYLPALPEASESMFVAHELPSAAA